MATDADFDAQIPQTLAFEGGLVNDPADPGGITNFGISKHAYPNLDIEHLTIEQARQIYFTDYWSDTGIHSLPGLVARKTFDLAVNMGARAAVMLLQRAINHTQAQEQIAVDGVIGRHTREAAQRCMQGALVQRLRIEASNHYQQLAADHPAFVKYLRGWLRRATA